MPGPHQPPSRIALSISTLVWQDAPEPFHLPTSAPRELGRYDVVQQPVKLGAPAWSSALQCFVCTPKRDAYAAAYGGASRAGHLGTFRTRGTGAPPLLFLHRVGTAQPFRGMHHGASHDACGPPFVFCADAGGGAAPPERFRGGAPHLQLDLPDLGCHFWGSAVEEEGAEDYEMMLDEDGVPSQVGWSAPWTGEVTYRVGAESQAATMTWEKEIWDEEERWGVRLEIEPHSGERDEKDVFAQDGHGFRLTLLEVYVKADLLTSDEL